MKDKARFIDPRYPCAKVAGVLVLLLSALASAASPPSTEPAALPHRDGMVRLPGGTVTIGNADPNLGYADEEGPTVETRVRPIWIDAKDVTNRQFKAFVNATHYVTIAEQKPDPKDFPGVPADALVAGSVVFTPPGAADLKGDIAQWWKFTPGASWQHPGGPGSTIEGRMDHPVVQVAFDDAVAYAKWAGKRLPTEVEWEYAARGGLVDKTFVWGDVFSPGGKFMANTWDGDFPVHNTKADGFAGTSPVGSFPPNGFGLYDMAGNVWQWTTTWYRPGHDPLEPTQQQSYDPDEPGVAKRVIKGGSFLCAANYCKRYRPAARSRTTPDTGLSNVGFRCVRDVKPGE